MTGSSKPPQRIALLDANVLFTELLRDILLRAAEHDLYQLRVSRDIWHETVRNLISTGTMSVDQATHLTEHATRFFTSRDAFVYGYESLVPTLTNHPKDRHVLAAAIVGGATVIVTFNRKDFPAAALDPYDIRAERPGVFLADLFAQHMNTLVNIIQARVKHNQNPPTTASDVLIALKKNAPEFAEILAPHLS